jgi:hypothetical protein
MLSIVQILIHTQHFTFQDVVRLTTTLPNLVADYLVKLSLNLFLGCNLLVFVTIWVRIHNSFSS